MLSSLTDKSPLLKGLLDFVFPPLCLGCGEFNDNRPVICESCRSKIDTYEHPICLNCFETLPGAQNCPVCREKSAPLFAYGDYASPLQDIIIQFKFRGITSPATLFAPLLYKQFQRQLQSLKAEMLIPVPLYPSREKHRGYNQAALFAEQLAELLDLPVSKDLLFRVEKRKPQAKLKFEKRAENIKGAFTVAEEAEKGGRVILVDDVVTSGATATEARNELEKAGYRVCAVVAIAHGR
jgi:ComF family protein